ncbi:MAG: M23 family metallopeptidase [Flavobacteriales bacterium]|nr:M23 family metallopeptidase [Flavobacteriales bacterium]
MQEAPKKKLRQRLKNKYRLVVMNDDTFEEKMSLKLTPINVYALIGTFTILLIALGITLVAFTPLRQYVPGYTAIQLRKQAIGNALAVDTLEEKLRLYEQYFGNLQHILAGEDTTGQDTILPSGTSAVPSDYQNIELSRSKAESELIEKIESEDKFNLAFNEPVPSSGSRIDMLFYTPVKGLITSGFDAQEKHYGIDIVSAANEPVKATLDGKVILSTWTSETGYIITIQHKHNLVSLYKHNAVLLKKTGEFVKAGEAIAIMGDSGELTNGPHLHFELWHSGQAVNPQDYILF